MCSEGWAQQSKIRDGSARWGPYGEGCQLIWCVASGTGHPGRFFIIKECLFGPYRWGGWYILLFILATWLWKIPAWCWSRFKEPPFNDSIGVCFLLEIGPDAISSTWFHFIYGHDVPFYA